MAAAQSLKTTSAQAGSLFRRADGVPRRVLYAEDQVSARVVTKALLERMGFMVDAVDDGEVAVEMARSGAYDIILLDIEMPVMDGVTAARAIRAEVAACRDTPILALSAFLADSTENSLWRDAFDSAVPKPANSNDLQRAMSRAMAKHGASQAKLESCIAPLAESLWDGIQGTLPKGTRILMIATAAGEMRHMALALAAAREAGDLDNIRTCRHALKGLALNFGAREVVRVIAESSAEPRSLNMPAVFDMIDEWRIKNSH